MSAEYVKQTNTVWAQVGFVALNVGPGASNDDTYSWV